MGTDVPCRCWAIYRWFERANPKMARNLDVARMGDLVNERFVSWTLAATVSDYRRAEPRAGSQGGTSSMARIISSLRLVKRFACETGASLVEYTLLVALIAAVAIGAMTYIGTSASSKLCNTGAAVAQGSGTPTTVVGTNGC